MLPATHMNAFICYIRNGIDTLPTKKANVSEETLVSIRKAGKNKTAILEAITGVSRENPDCIRVLRIAYFFHKNRSACIGLRTYLTNKKRPVDWNHVSAAKSEAVQAVLLSLEHADPVADYFIICIHKGVHQVGVEGFQCGLTQSLRSPYVYYQFPCAKLTSFLLCLNIGKALTFNVISHERNN
jgi:hypothetical protein